MEGVKSVAKFIVLMVITFIFLMRRVSKKTGYIDEDDVVFGMFFSVIIVIFIYLAFWAFS